MREPLIIAVAQPRCVPYDVAANAVTHATTVRDANARVVASASFAGSTGGGYANAAGRSAIWTSDGLVAAQAGVDPGAIATATLS